LLERDFECPNCESKVASLDKVTEDADLRLKIKAYIEEEIEKSKREASPGGGHHDLPEDGVKEEDGQKSPSKVGLRLRISLTPDHHC
jgi:protein MPE1